MNELETLITKHLKKDSKSSLIVGFLALPVGAIFAGIQLYYEFLNVFMIFVVLGSPIVAFAGFYMWWLRRDPKTAPIYKLLFESNPHNFVWFYIKKDGVAYTLFFVDNKKEKLQLNIYEEDEEDVFKIEKLIPENYPATDVGFDSEKIKKYLSNMDL